MISVAQHVGNTVHGAGEVSQDSAVVRMVLSEAAPDVKGFLVVSQGP